MRRPARARIGWCASHNAMSAAPTAGELRRMPSPHGPVCRMSRAKMGRSAVAPPNSTAKRSSEMAPRMAFLANTKRTPSSSPFQPAEAFEPSTVRACWRWKMNPNSRARSRFRRPATDQACKEFHPAQDPRWWRFETPWNSRPPRAENFGRDQHGQERSVGRSHEGAAHADERDHGEDPSRAGRRMQRECEQDCPDENFEREGSEQEGAPVEAIGRESPRQGEQKRRQELRQTHHAEREGAAGERVDLPAHGHAEHHESPWPSRNVRPGTEEVSIAENGVASAMDS
jgi:hypothetical protein